MNPRDLPVVHSLRASISALPRRVSHGGAAWLRGRGDELRQPQDGAHEAVSETLDKPLGILPASWSGEGEDARITGGTRCLMRRLMGLNVTSAKRDHPASALGFRKAFTG